MKLNVLPCLLLCLLVGVISGCGNPAMYRPAVEKLTSATNVVIESSEHILDESRRARQEAAILEAGLYANDKLGSQQSFAAPEKQKLSDNTILLINGELYRPDVSVTGASTPFDDTQLQARRDLFSTLKRTNTLLNKIVSEDYGDQASTELKGIRTKLNSIKGFKDGEDGDKAIAALSFILKNVIENKQAEAARRALLDLTAQTITNENGITIVGPLKAVVGLLRTDIQENYSKSILLPSVNSISQSRRRYLLSQFCSSSPFARQIALDAFKESQENLLAKYEMHRAYSQALKGLDESLVEVHKAAETPDFLLVLQHLEIFFSDAVVLKQALEKSEEAGESE